MVLQTRMVLLASLRAGEARKNLGDEPSENELLLKEAERATLLTLSAIARRENRKQSALNTVLRCREIAKAVDHDLALATASVLWLQNESVAAIESLRQFLRKHVDAIPKQNQAQLLSQMVRLCLFRHVSRLVQLMTLLFS